MKILVIHQYYLMPGQSGGSRFNEMAKLWAARGHEVEIIAGNVDYLTGARPEQYRGKWITKEQDGAVAVYRCHVPRSYAKGYGGRAWAFFGFTLSAATAALRVSPPDVVIATSPPLVTPIPGWVAARWRRRRRPWIFEIRDLWPESAVTTGVLSAGGLLTRILYGLEKWACRHADKINVLTPAFQRDLERRGLASAGKIVQVPNGADTEAFHPGPPSHALREELGWGQRFVALYAGAHGRANALRQLLDAAEELRDRPDILIACIGDGPERAGLQAEAERRGLAGIHFHAAHAKAYMPEIMRTCDAGVAVLQNNPTFLTVYPNKVFDCMASGRPVLLAIDGVIRELVCDRAQAGIFVQPEDGKAIGAALRHLADHPEQREAMGARGRKWMVANGSRPALAERYLEVMEQLLPGYRPVGPAAATVEGAS